MWMDGPFSDFHVTGTTIRNTYADGILTKKTIRSKLYLQIMGLFPFPSLGVRPRKKKSLGTKKINRDGWVRG